MNETKPFLSTRDIIHAGFFDISQANALFHRLSEYGATTEYIHEVLNACGQALDPDNALSSFVILLENGQITCNETEQTLRNVLLLAGASSWLATMLNTRPYLLQAAKQADQALSITRQQRIDAMLEACHEATSTTNFAQQCAALRKQYYTQLVAIATYDVTQPDPVAIQPQVSQALSDLVDASLTAALAIAQSQVEGSQYCQFAVIGMGKLGAQEINYISDVDLVYVCQAKEDAPQGFDATRVGTKIAMMLAKACQSPIAGCTEPALWSIDTALRPEGKDGPLVRTLASFANYYESWAENWEFQALLKARAVAGDSELAEAYIKLINPLIWSASARPNFVSDCQHMRTRVESLIPADQQDREIKLGKGGLRDVEFSVQMLQLVHGRTDESLHVRPTHEAINRLTQGGYISRKISDKLQEDYSFERVLEHRLQLWAGKRTHLFPDLGSGNIGGLDRPREIRGEELAQNKAVRRLARCWNLLPDELVARFDRTRIHIRKIHRELYYRPMLPISAGLDDEQVKLSPAAIRERFAAIGFADPDAAARHVTALSEGLSRAAKINRILLPAVLQWLSQGQNPDMGLLGWRKLEELHGDDSDYLGFLRDSSSAAERLCRVLSNSRLLTAALEKSGESIHWLGDDSQLTPRSRESLATQTRAIVSRHQHSLRDVTHALRAMRRHEIERIALSWMSGLIDVPTCLEAASQCMDAVLSAAFDWAYAHQVQEFGTAKARVAILALGRYGGGEMNFSSDADCMVIYDPLMATNSGQSEQREVHNAEDPRESQRFALAVLNDIRAIATDQAGGEPKIELDLDLRPEGKNGPLVRSLASCATYYASWAEIWEAQALLRARFAAGSSELANEFFDRVANPFRYRKQPLDSAQLANIRKLKARMESERLPRGVRSDRHLKLGKGGLSDIEWTVQLLQLQHAYEIHELRTTSTLEALVALEAHGFIASDQAHTLHEAWLVLTAVRNANYLANARVSQADIVPDDMYSLGSIAVILGYPAHHGGQLDNQIMAYMRKCRDIMQRLFYGTE